MLSDVFPHDQTHGAHADDQRGELCNRAVVLDVLLRNPSCCFQSINGGIDVCCGNDTILLIDNGFENGPRYVLHG
jgi:hypothetical protein